MNRRIPFLSVAVFASVAGVHALDAYPSSYPFENESYPPSGPLAQTPSYTYTQDDPGGYAYTSMYARVLTEEEVPGFCIYQSGARSFMFVHDFKWPPYFDTSVYHNCTKQSKGIMDSTTFRGKLGDYDICEPKSCCPDYQGVMARSTNDQETYNKIYKTYADILPSGLCKEVFHEGVYCAVTSNEFLSFCIEQYITVTERTILPPCYDSYYNWVFTCPLYAKAGLFIAAYEPLEYVSRSSVAENQATQNVKDALGDKVCKPYSYYYPNTAKSNQNLASTSASTSDESSSFILTTLCLSLSAFFLL